MEPKNQDQTLETNEYMTPARQEDLQQKLKAEEAYVDKWAHTANIDQPEETTTKFDNDEATTSTGPAPPTQTTATASAQSFGGAFETSNTNTDNFDNYSTPHEVGQEYAVLSLVLAIVSPLAGFILAFVAIKKSKQSHQKNRLAKISLLVNLLFLVLITGFIIFLLTPTEPTSTQDDTTINSTSQDASTTNSSDSSTNDAGQ